MVFCIVHMYVYTHTHIYIDMWWKFFFKYIFIKRKNININCIMSSIMVTFLFIKNVKTHNKTIEGSASYLEEEEYKQIFFKGFVGPESLVASFDANAII